MRGHRALLLNVSKSWRAMLRVPAALIRPSCTRTSPSKDQRGRRECRVLAATHGPPANKKAGGSYHRSSRNIRHSLRDGFNGVLRALPGARAFLPPSSARSSCRLDTSVGVSGPHDFSVRIGPFVHALTARCDPMRPSHPALSVRDDREAPLWIECGTARIMPLIWGRRQVSFW